MCQCSFTILGYSRLEAKRAKKNHTNEFAYNARDKAKSNRFGFYKESDDRTFKREKNGVIQPETLLPNVSILKVTFYSTEFLFSKFLMLVHFKKMIDLLLQKKNRKLMYVRMCNTNKYELLGASQLSYYRLLIWV